jgi:hypothetical protein
MGQGTADRPGRPLRPDLADLADQGIQSRHEILIFVLPLRLNVSRGSGPQWPGGQGGGFLWWFFCIGKGARFSGTG